MARGTGNGGEAARQVEARQGLMRVCAEATEAELERALSTLGDLPEVQDLRSPQTGLVMLRGRIGGDGQPFNFGEAIVTRAAVRLENGATGYSYLLGRAHRRARLAAIVDALGQDLHNRARLEQSLVAPVTARAATEHARVRAETAATRVEFFTLVRGED
jgi:alpha-D-ribose 1-methylphosphonate 5-triphosphate synthase subunit PhnG